MGKLKTRLPRLLLAMTSYPLSKALITLCRDEMSERISTARTVTERKVHLALRERGKIATQTAFARNDKTWDYIKKAKNR